MRILLFLLLTLAVHAEPPLWKLEVQIVRVPAAQARLAACQTWEVAEWNELLRSGRLAVMESGSLICSLNRDSLAMVGGKIPIGYRDPRVDGYQVQYIDTGWKIDAKLDETGQPGVLKVECRTQHSALSGDSAAGLPEQDTLLFQSTVQLKAGQVAVVAAGRGLISSQYVKKILPKETFLEGDTLMFAVKVTKP